MNHLGFARGKVAEIKYGDDGGAHSICEGQAGPVSPQMAVLWAA